MRRSKTAYSSEGLQMARDYEMCLSNMCHHVSNDEFYGQPFLLEEFQRENMWKPLFACGEMTAQGFKRKHRRAVFGLPSGFGKTEFAAALVMVIATMEPIFNGQYGVVASSKDQVRNIFEKIVTQIKLNSIWTQQWEIGKNIITNKETGAKIMVLPNKADALESWHFNVLVFDELHVYKDNRVWDAGVKGQKVLNNPLTIGITTAADTRDCFLWQLLDVIDNDPAAYLYWLGLDDDKDINKRKSWEPLLCASWVSWENIQEQKNMAGSARAFERYTANRFPRNRDEYSCFTSGQLDKLTRKANDWDWELPYTIGIDGATSGDSFAIVLYQEKEDEDGKTHANAREFVFDTPNEETGHYDLSQIMELIAGLCSEHYPEVIGIDPNRLIVMNSQLQQLYGIECVSFAQNNVTMCQACSLVVNSVKDGSLRLKGCPKLKEHLLNTVELPREPYGMRFGKDSKKSKIDAAIALAIAELAYNKLVAGTADSVPIY